MDYYFAPSTIALAPLIVLHDVGAAFTPHRLDFYAREQQSPEYLAINPKGRVPALVIDGTILTETPAILAYLAQTHPQAGLAPADPLQFARLQAFNSYIASTLHVNHAHRMRGYRWVDGKEHREAMRAKVPQTVGASFAYIEEEVFKGPFVMGETYTIADPYLFTVARWIESDGVDASAFPKISAHRDMMAARPTAQAALALEAA